MKFNFWACPRCTTRYSESKPTWQRGQAIRSNLFRMLLKRISTAILHAILLKN